MARPPNGTMASIVPYKLFLGVRHMIYVSLRRDEDIPPYRLFKGNVSHYKLFCRERS